MLWFRTWCTRKKRRWPLQLAHIGYIAGCESICRNLRWSNAAVKSRKNGEVGWVLTKHLTLLLPSRCLSRPFVEVL